MTIKWAIVRVMTEHAPSSRHPDAPGSAPARGRIILAEIAPFNLGNLFIDPPLRSASPAGSPPVTLEPRVMRVLVALAQADGGVVSRESLIDRCWDGVVVGDDAIHRVIARIRRLAESDGRSTFRVQTVTKVGYRLQSLDRIGIVPDASVGHHPATGDKPDRTRRNILVGAASAALAVAGGGIWFVATRPRISPTDPLVAELYHRGQMAQRTGLPDQTRVAIAQFREAVRADPQFADGWGALALALRHSLNWGGVDVDQTVLEIRSAASRALSMDPNNADAEIALAAIPSPFRNWLPYERAMRTVMERHPENWLPPGLLGNAFGSSGRSSDSVGMAARQYRLDPLVPLNYVNRAWSLFSANRLQEANDVSAAGLRRWPEHHIIWRDRFQFLLLTRQFTAAREALDPANGRPLLGFAEKAMEVREQLLAAVEHDDRSARAGAIEGILQRFARQMPTIEDGVPQLALLGEHDLALDCIEAYLLDPAFADASPVEARHVTRYLFFPTLAPIHGHPRMLRVFEAIGLEEYWRTVRTIPDFRRSMTD